MRLSLRAEGDPANVAFWASPIVSGAPAEPFNVIVLVEDAERADYLSLYGHPARTTPFKEKLAAERGWWCSSTPSPRPPRRGRRPGPT